MCFSTVLNDDNGNPRLPAPNYSDCYPATPDDKDLHHDSGELTGRDWPPMIKVKPGEDTSDIPRFCVLVQG